MASRSRMLFSSSTTRTRASLMSSSSRGVGFRRSPSADRSGASGCSSAPTSEWYGSPPDGSIGRREGQDERGAIAYPTPYLDGSAVLLDYPVDERQADAATLRLGREERLEDMGEVSVRDALAGVGDGDLEPTAALTQRTRTHPELSPIRHRLHRVEAEIPDRLAEPLRIRAGREGIAVFAGHFQIGGQGPVLDQQQDLVEDLRHVDLERHHRRRARILQKVSHDLIEAGRLSEHDLDELAPGVVGGQVPRQCFDRARDGSQRVPDLVRHVGRQAPDRGQPVRLTHALLHLLDAREILTDSYESGHIAVSRSQRPEGDSDRYLLAVASPEAELVAGCGLAAFGDGLAHVVEIHAVAEDGVPRLIDRLVRPDSGDGLRRSVEGGDLPGGIHADEAGADRLEDQVPKRLEIREMLTLILHVLLEFVIPPSQRAGEDGQDLDRGVLGGLADLEHRKDGPTPHRQHVEETAHRRDDEPARLRQCEAGGDHEQDIEWDEHRLGTATLVHDSGDQYRVEGELEPRDSLRADIPPVGQGQHQTGRDSPEDGQRERPEGI